MLFTGSVGVDEIAENLTEESINKFFKYVSKVWDMNLNRACYIYFRD